MSLPEDERENFVHGHSNLVRLLDEVEAHVEGLASCETPNFMIAEMMPYWNAFKTELLEHVEEEETLVFPQLGGHSDRGIQKLSAQHKDLETRIDEITQFIETYSHDDENFRRFQWLIENFRVAFKRHSAEEREYIARSIGRT